MSFKIIDEEEIHGYKITHQHDFSTNEWVHEQMHKIKMRNENLEFISEHRRQTVEILKSIIV